MTSLSLARTRITDSGLASLGTRKQLNRLDLDGVEVRATALLQLKELSDLTELRLGCKTLNDLFAPLIGELKALAKLEKLSLTDSGIGDGTLKRLHDFPALTELDLTGTKVTANAVAAAKTALPKRKIVGPGK